ncbi:hypothetical protein O6H91_02G120900 [Diphasiastrum complanatum]|uniref:Uncharacterized protein n=1 Tax=Diphasiastrum complanatum TaxID=34168 RepID=A0ACC2EK20_DIPCM|nr:hypothetical protein O6H91_02G120900 [Diphasiastrum complanatum]
MQAGKANRFRCRSEVSPAFVLCSNGLFRRTTRDATSETDQKLILASGWSLCMEISYEHPGTPSSAPTTPSNLSTDSPFYTLHTFSSVVQTQPGLSSPEALNPSPSPFPTASDTSLYPSDETMDAVPHPQLAGRMMAAMTSAMEMDQQESGKKKRGRPRKYGPGAPGSAALILAPIQSIDGCISASPFPEKKRGRPPGSGKKQHLSSKGCCNKNHVIFPNRATSCLCAICEWCNF